MLDELRITDVDDLVENEYYHVRLRGGRWMVRQYSPASKAFTKYGNPVVAVSLALAGDVVPVSPEPVTCGCEAKKM